MGIAINEKFFCSDPWDRRKEMQLGQNIVARASELEKRSISNSRSNTDLKKIVEATDGECITMESSSFLTVQDVDTADSNIVQVCRMKEELLNEISEFGKDLPPNTLDQLIDELGGSENVAEMTGRKGRIIQTEEGDIHYESRSESDIPLEILNLTEKKR
ncbi:hypothetical protein QAD02_008421 [Eretmocerus hayati]|uniref:Uncharacterized protein n=1 Tax=Eretmocerus hayati TaxID=131215 RepID=A0ACC2N6C9_9HYME|nr:hypothetical protein QAD02_008421 [Eretmocerus hayati]